MSGPVLTRWSRLATSCRGLSSPVQPCLVGRASLVESRRVLSSQVLSRWSRQVTSRQVLPGPVGSSWSRQV